LRWSLEELKLTSQYWFRFEETNKDHIVISGIPVNVTERSLFGVRTVIE
jgi:hypothetical protein